MIEQINNDLKEAMKTQDKFALSVLRMLKSALQLEKISLKRELLDQDVLMVIKKNVKQRKDSIAEYEKYGKTEEMENLEKDKKYSLTQMELQKIQEYFNATFCDDSYCLETINQNALNGLIIDPHTACGFKAYEEIQKETPNTPCVLCSTAEWTKFAPTLAKALKLGSLSDEQALQTLAKNFSLKIPEQILNLFAQKEIHTQTMDKDKIYQAILEWL